MQLYTKTINSPIGALRLICHEHALLAVLWQHEQPHHTRNWQSIDQSNHAILNSAEQQLQQYFLGQRQQFELPTAFIGGTDFQQQVWSTLLHIPYAQTCSYKTIAEQVGRPNAMRAVGAANGQNPLSIVAPCHRVIGANQKLVGYAGGLDKKQFLLNLETKYAK